MMTVLGVLAALVLMPLIGGTLLFAADLIDSRKD